MKTVIVLLLATEMMMTMMKVEGVRMMVGMKEERGGGYIGEEKNMDHTHFIGHTYRPIHSLLHQVATITTTLCLSTFICDHHLRENITRHLWCWSQQSKRSLVSSCLWSMLGHSVRRHLSPLSSQLWENSRRQEKVSKCTIRHLQSPATYSSQELCIWLKKKSKATEKWSKKKDPWNVEHQTRWFFQLWKSLPLFDIYPQWIICGQLSICVGRQLSHSPNNRCSPEGVCWHLSKIYNFASGLLSAVCWLLPPSPTIDADLGDAKTDICTTDLHLICALHIYIDACNYT